MCPYLSMALCSLSLQLLSLAEITAFDAQCGSAVNESVLGCTLQLYIPPDATQPFLQNVSTDDPMVMRVVLGYSHLDVVRLVFGAVDGAGNVGRNATFVWRVDTEVGGFLSHGAVRVSPDPSRPLPRPPHFAPISVLRLVCRVRHTARSFTSMPHPHVYMMNRYLLYGVSLYCTTSLH
jgi:hypothetical protein